MFIKGLPMIILPLNIEVRRHLGRLTGTTLKILPRNNNFLFLHTSSTIDLLLKHFLTQSLEIYSSLTLFTYVPRTHRVFFFNTSTLLMSSLLLLQCRLPHSSKLRGIDEHGLIFVSNGTSFAFHTNFNMPIHLDNFHTLFFTSSVSSKRK